ncbi:MAG: NYN domain-containing protein, partial [Myxococcota bacterium]
MTNGKDTAPNLAVFCDYENVAIGVQDAKYDTFDIGLVLERLLDKGKIVVKKAYADWDRYKDAKKPMHEAAFELIEIPHVRYSGKNSADIRMVVDALDLCYTKEHIDTFVIISGDSDFSPLVSKLRENAKTVIGVGVRNSTSDLLMSNCDEFIFYDDLIAKPKARRSRSRSKAKAADAGKSGDIGKGGDAERTSTRAAAAEPTEYPGDPAREAIDLVVETADALFAESGDRSKLWGSMVKQTLKRRRPSFSESAAGFSSFSDLLEEAEARGRLELELDEKSGGYVIRGTAQDA